MSPSVRVVLPVRTWSESNLRLHWSRRASRAATQRGLARLLVGRTLRLHAVETAGALEITLVRIAPCRLDDDNLAAACKAVRDGIADALGLDDGDARLTWHYAQRRGGVREYAVEVTIQSLPSDERAAEVRP